jgi:hypothetical protein
VVVTRGGQGIAEPRSGHSATAQTKIYGPSVKVTTSLQALAMLNAYLRLNGASMEIRDHITGTMTSHRLLKGTYTRAD